MTPQTFTCPPWCTAHQGGHGTYRRGEVLHAPDEAVIVLDVSPASGLRELAVVSPCRMDWEDGEPSSPRVELSIDSPMSPADSRKVADVLMWAADLLDPRDIPGGTFVAPTASIRAFPVGQRREGDERFGSALAYDVARVLADHGYPMPAAGADLAALQRLLGGFLYGGGAQ